MTKIVVRFVGIQEIPERKFGLVVFTKRACFEVEERVRAVAAGTQDSWMFKSKKTWPKHRLKNLRTTFEVPSLQKIPWTRIEDGFVFELIIPPEGFTNV